MPGSYHVSYCPCYSHTTELFLKTSSLAMFTVAHHMSCTICMDIPLSMHKFPIALKICRRTFIAGEERKGTREINTSLFPASARNNSRDQNMQLLLIQNIVDASHRKEMW